VIAHLHYTPDSLGWHRTARDLGPWRRIINTRREMAERYCKYGKILADSLAASAPGGVLLREWHLSTLLLWSRGICEREVPSPSPH
jgi:hypothetical protein